MDLNKKQKYRIKQSEISNSQEMVLKDLNMKRGFRVYSVDELDLPLIFNYDQEINRAKNLLKRDRDFQFIFNLYSIQRWIQRRRITEHRNASN
jgi:hypothetical protein